MLSTLLNTLQSGLLGSRTYFFGSFLPLALFFLASLSIGATTFPRLHALLGALVTERPGSAAAGSLLTLLVSAYVLSAVNTSLRRLLEGEFRFFPPPPLRSELLRRELKVAAEARRNFERHQRSYFELVRPGWVEQLREARKQGASKPPPAEIPGPILAAVEALEKRKARFETLTLADLGAVLSDLKTRLESSSANDKASAVSRRLNSLHIRVVDLVDYAARRLQNARLAAYKSFAAFPDSIAPTRLGNIAGTLRSYASSRYGLPLDLLWTRFQRVVQDDEKLNGTLQDAKVQLDFLVSLAWLAGLFVVAWSVALAIYSRALGTYLLLALAGPFLVYLLYWLACQAYLTFAEVVRSAVDLRRFDLLAALRIPPPAYPDQEREVWGRVGAWLGHGNAPDGVFFRGKS
jgi:hypothetical protein